MLARGFVPALESVPAQLGRKIRRLVRFLGQLDRRRGDATAVKLVPVLYTERGLVVFKNLDFKLGDKSAFLKNTTET